MIENARWSDASRTGIVCDLDGVPGAFVPAGHHLLDGFEGEIADPAEAQDAPEPVPASIERAQFAQVLALDHVISEDEAFAYAARGDLPKALLDALAKIPAKDRFPAKMALARPSYERAHPLVPMLGALLADPATGKPYDADALDGLWRRGGAL